MKKFFLILAFALFSSSCLFAADTAEVPAERFKHSFDAKNFKLNQDGMKYEVPENAAYKIIPRLKNTEIWTNFPVPSEAKSYLEWVVTAIVRGSDGPGAGVALWGESDGFALYVYPDGRGLLRQYEGKKPVWTKEFSVKNFAYPANLTIWRDANGSIVAKVDGIVVATKLLDVDVRKPQTTEVTSVSFATRATGGKSGASASYEKLDVEGWGTRDTSHLFKDR
ncbi:hypothetical protein LJC31_07880 [Synergistaceae bacterium OttesenSCG-928-I11]|nr:hypothetical protein [Synergistaceae bacterium OttesenSCG-928-I11]